MSFFAKNLRFLRKRGNHNQDEIAILFNKQANTIGNWENRKSEPSLQELIKLGEFFKVSTGDLLQTDLELNPKGTSVTFTGDASSPTDKFNNGAEYAAGAGETGADAFWVILRELRSLHEKVDLLITNRESAERKRDADKSAH